MPFTAGKVCRTRKTPWFPWTSKTNVEQLETAQLAVARAITNLVSTTPREVFRKEADLQPLAQRLRELTLPHADKWLQLQPNDPRHEMFTGNVASHLRHTGWRELMLPELRRLGLDAQPSQSNPAPSPPSWIVPQTVPTFKTDGSKMESPATQLSAAIQCIAKRGQGDIQLFTYRSTIRGQ